MSAMKTLKFKPQLIASLRAGTKTSTWRLFDDKDLSVGDVVSIMDKSTLDVVGTARISAVSIRPLGEVWQTELDGHESYKNEEDMLATFSSYYGDSVTLATDAKVLHFTNIEFTSTL